MNFLLILTEKASSIQPTLEYTTVLQKLVDKGAHIFNFSSKIQDNFKVISFQHYLSLELSTFTETLVYDEFNQLESWYSTNQHGTFTIFDAQKLN